MLTAPRPTADREVPPVGRPALAVVPVHVHDDAGLDAVVRRLVSLSSCAPDLPIIVASGGDSDPALLDAVAVAAAELGGELVRGPASVVAAVNAGLNAACEAQVDAVLVAGDVEFVQRDWLDRLRARRDTQGRPAAVTGARLVHPGGVLAAAGRYFSLLSREWLPRLQYAPADLPAALTPCLCPVTGLVLVRVETLAQIGIFDETLTYEHAELDFCLRAFAAGLECVYEPAATAALQAAPAPAVPRMAAAEREHERSTWALRDKHRHADFSLWTPEV